MNNLLASRFVGLPSLVAPDMRARFESALAAVMSHPDRDRLLSAPSASADDGFWPGADDWRAAYRPYVVAAGILFIPVKGVLLHDFPWALGSWATGYVYIARALERGLADPGVQGIALVCDSYGGEVAGCFELVDKIFAARGQKPIRAFAHEYAFSAGYAVACAAESIAVSRTGGVGSIGVVCAHVDVSKAMDEMGVKVTFIFAGAHKVDGNAYEPLPKDVKARIQDNIDACYDIFVASVARNRGLDEKAVRGTEALTFTAQQAVTNGLADTIGPLDDAVAAFAADLSSPADDDDDDQGDDSMSKDKSAAELAAEQAAAIETARAEGRTEGKAEGVKEGVAAERTRMKGILGCDEAKGRGKLASHFAFSTEMTVETAQAALKESPVEAATQGKTPNRLEQAMDAIGNPKVGADISGDGSDEQAVAAHAAETVALYRGKPVTAH